MSRTACGVSLVLLSLLAAAPAAGQTATDHALAESLFREGRELMDKGELAEACPKLAESQRLDHALGTLLNLALCHEKLGRVTSAWSEFNDAADEAARAHDDREAFARKHIAALEPTLPRVHLTVEPSNETLADLKIAVDGVAVGRAAWSAALPVDPGLHYIDVSAGGKKKWSSTFEAAGGGAPVSVEVPRLEDLPKETPILGPAVPVPALYTNPAPAPEGDRGDTQRTVGYVVGAAGIVGVAVGIAFGLHAITLKNDRDAECFPGNVCTADGLSKDDDARSAATFASIGFIGGAALLAGGAALVLTAPRARASASIQRLGSGTGLVVGGGF